MDTQTLTIKLAAEVAEFISKIKGVESLVSGVAQRMRDSFSGLWATLGATVSVAGLGAFVKSSINAMDQLDELSQRYGISVKELSGLQLAFKQSGIEQDAMASSMGKLQRAMADGNRGLAAIGVGTRNADGSLRGTSAVLLDVADKFAGLQDGAGKTALAVEILGKSGADMVPLLNSGSDGIKDMISTAERLGLVLEDEVAAKAGNFNDTLELVGMGAQGVGRGIAARLLPTLQSLAENFLTSMTNGDRLAKTAEFLANILKGLYIGALAVVEVFSTLGKTFGAVIGAFFEAAKGNFKEAWAILKEGGADISKGWTETAAQISAAWSGAGGDTVAALAAAGGAAKKHAPDLKAIEENAKAAAKALEELRKNDLKVGELRNKMVGEAAKAEADYQAAVDARNFDAAWEADQKNLGAVDARIKAGRTTLEQLQFENSLLAMNTTEREVATAMRELERQGVVAGTEAWTKYAAAIQTAVVDREAAKKATDFWQSIETTAKGVFTDVANDGVSAFERIGKTLKASVLDVLWQITGRQWLISIGTAAGLPGAAMAGQASAGTSLMGGAGNAASLANLLGGSSALATASGAVTGFTAAMTGAAQSMVGITGTTAQMTASLTAAGHVAAPGMAAGVSAGTTLAAAVPYVAAALVAANALGLFRTTKVADTSLTGTWGSGDIRVSDTMRKSGTLFRGPSYWEEDRGVHAASAELQSAFDVLRTGTAESAKAIGLNAGAVATYTRKIRFSTNGLSQDQVAAKLQEEFGLLGDEMAQLALGTYEYTKAGEGSAAALARLSSSLVGVNATFDALGRTLYSADLIGADMASQLADAFGGLANVASASQAYFAAYYSDAERAATGTRLLTAQFGELGLTFPASEAGFRALVDGLDLTTESGRTTYAELLKLAPEYKTLSELQKTIAAEQLRIAQENGKKVAEALLHSFTGGGAIVPALGSVGQAINTVAGQSGTLQGSLEGTNFWMHAMAGQSGNLRGSLEGTNFWMHAMAGQSGNLRGSLEGTNFWMHAMAGQSGNLQGSLNGATHWLWMVADQSGNLQGSLAGANHWLYAVADQSGNLQGSLAGANHWLYAVAGQSGNLQGSLAGANHWLYAVAGQSGNLRGSLEGTNFWMHAMAGQSGNLRGSLEGTNFWMHAMVGQSGNLQGSLNGATHWLWMVADQSGNLQGSLAGANHWLYAVADQSGNLQGSLAGANHWLYAVAGQSGNLQGSLAGVNHWTWTVATQTDLLAGRYSATADIQGDLALATGALFAQFGLGEVSATDLAKATFTFGTDADNTARAADFAAVQLAGMAVQLGGVNAASAGFAGQVHAITRVLGDASSGTLYFGDRLVTMTGQLNPAQLAVSGLQAEIANLRLSAGVVNMAGLIAQVDSLYRAAGGFADQEFAATFVNTIAGVFETIGARVKDTLGQIATERAAVREAAISIINPTAKTSAQIATELSGVRVGGIDNSSLLSAQSQLALYQNHVDVWSVERARLEQEKAAAKQRADELHAEAGRVKAEVDARANSYNYSFEASASYGGQQELSRNTAGVDLGVDGTRSRAETWYWHGAIESRPWEYNQVGEGGSSLVWNDYQKLNSAVDASNSMIASLGTLTSQYVNAVREVDAGKGAVAHWEAVSAKAALDYTAALQQYSISSSKAVTQLGRLRSEAVAWYESQKQLADSMSSGAATLRQTVADYRFSQLDTASQARVLQEQFSLAYSMALSTSGETLVGYGQRLNDLINPLLQTAQDSGMDATAYAGLVSTVLARSEAVAARLDDLAPKNYQAESLGLLGSIDSVLASLEAGAKSADQLIVEALKASQEATRAGFQAVVAALTGNAIPAFASGGYYPGGLALVGERGPEFINFANPGQVYTADQTAQMLAGPAVQPWAGGFGGGMQATFDRMAQQMASMAREIASLRAENRQFGIAIAANTGRLARYADRWDGEGLPTRNADNTTLKVETV